MRSDHLRLDPVDRISTSEIRLGCAPECVGPAAQDDRARTGDTPEKNEPLPGSLGAWFHLRLRPRRAAVDADIDPLDSTVCPCPSPNLLQYIALECLARRRRNNDGFRRNRPNWNGLSRVFSGCVENRVVIPARGKGPRRPCFSDGHSRKPFDAVSSIKTRDNEAGGKTVFGRQRTAIDLVSDQDIVRNTRDRKILNIG